MQAFEHVNATTIDEATRLLAADPQARAIAGGTDLVPEMRLGVREPDRLINLKTIQAAAGISDVHGHVQIGALTRLADVAAHPLIQSNFPILAAAIRAAASPQIRNAATIGGNLCQDSRCWYFRGPFACWLKGGTCCDAEHGENRHHAIFGGGQCYTVHPSDPATALLALNARVMIHGVEGERTVSIQDFFTLPHDNHRALNVLEPGDLVSRIDVPWPAGERSTFLKAQERASFGFTLASVACAAQIDGGRIRTVRLALGGVAPIPWRSLSCEHALVGHRLDDQTIERGAHAATHDARPLATNDYKVPLVQELVRRALRQFLD